MEKTLKQVFFCILSFSFAIFAASCTSTPPNEKETGYHLGPTSEQLASEKIFPISTADPHVFEAPGIGRFVTVGADTVVQQAKMPSWASEPWVKTPPIATAAFERQNGKTYNVLVFELREGEIAQDWMKRSEAGDAYLSEQIVYTRNGKFGFAYQTNDYGLFADIHVTVFSDRYVYYFKAPSENPEDRPHGIPEDFLAFIREVEVQ